ncbi:MAG: hypothetical protein QF842_08190 [Candidatus Marinimicrobia bacterium]|jgi:hypothetical protein|nr:hypothetical protein [Candidatus Neomarinimicrobiota bacterium]MDP6610939.1 hypothetical protein [Candidatus Neomarinimicrobiota bacterium]|tara:strand:+ start:6543 stop:6701 length:159 start_codon:yes stop_codon:yes gene_type:complete
MDLQTIIAYGIGFVAVVYVVHIIIRQLNKSEVDPKCDDCPVPDIMDKKKNSD